MCVCVIVWCGGTLGIFFRFFPYLVGLWAAHVFTEHHRVDGGADDDDDDCTFSPPIHVMVYIYISSSPLPSSYSPISMSPYHRISRPSSLAILVPSSPLVACCFTCRPVSFFFAFLSVDPRICVSLRSAGGRGFFSVFSVFFLTVCFIYIHGDDCMTAYLPTYLSICVCVSVRLCPCVCPARTHVIYIASSIAQRTCVLVGGVVRAHVVTSRCLSLRLWRLFPM